MFDSLAEQIRQDEQGQVSSRERMIRWLAVAVLSILVFGGLYFGIQVLQ